MTELPADDPHEVIHLGDQAAVVVPLDEYRQLRQEALRARLIEQNDARRPLLSPSITSKRRLAPWSPFPRRRSAAVSGWPPS